MSASPLHFACPPLPGLTTAPAPRPRGLLERDPGCSVGTALLPADPASWHSSPEMKRHTFSFPTFSGENDSLSDPLLLNCFLMKCYYCTPLHKEHMWLQVINYTLEEPNKRLSSLKYFMATINFFSLIIRVAME